MICENSEITNAKTSSKLFLPETDLQGYLPASWKGICCRFFVLRECTVLLCFFSMIAVIYFMTN